VAPDAQIMVCRVRTVADSVAESQCWQAMQFVVAPDSSPENGADLYTMSLGWQLSWLPHQATWRGVADNVNAAGVIQVVAAGNERSINPPNSCRCPGNVPPPWWNPENTGEGTLSGIMSIGATDSTDAIAYFSSRGPVTWQNVPPYNDYAYPPGLTRPDMSAPGVAVKSCRVGGGYTEMDGTSMATPHVAGTVCLMLSKNPLLTPAAVDSILEITAVDLGTSGKDCDFGAGRIDAFAAVSAVPRGPVLELRRVIVRDSSGNNDGYIDPGETAGLCTKFVNTGNANCANTQGRLRSLDFRLTVIDSLGSWGTIAEGESAINFSDQFVIRADTSVRQGTLLPCSLFISGESTDYEDAYGFSLLVGMPGQVLIDHDTNNCRLSVTCLGAIGYLEPGGAGSGFAYPKNGPSLLRHASFAFGTDSNYVVDRYYSRPVTSPPDTEFFLIDSVRSLFPPQKGDEHFRAWYSDRNHPRKKPMVTIQNSYAVGAQGYRDFVVITYDVQNNSSSRLSGFHTGVFADFTIDTLGKDICRTDSLRRFIYITDSIGRGPFVGIKILEPDSGVHLSAIDPRIYYLPDSSFRDAQKWRFLSGQINLINPTRADNWAVSGSAGPFTLEPFAACRFAIAFVGGETQSAAVANADSAQSWYHRCIGLIEKPAYLKTAETELKILPNPFANRVVISYQMPVVQPVRIRAVDVTGRTAGLIYEGNINPGEGKIVWEPKGLTQGVYFIRVESPGVLKTERAVLIR